MRERRASGRRGFWARSCWGGDGTVAYFCDRKREIPMKKLARQIRKRRHAVKSLKIVSSSGARYKDFVDQIARDADSGGGPYDEYVLFGGWNDDTASEGYVEKCSGILASMWYDEFAIASSEGRWPTENAGRNRSPWSDDEWAEWRQARNQQDRTQEDWGSWGYYRPHRTWTEEEWKEWGENSRERLWGEEEWSSWLESGNQRRWGRNCAPCENIGQRRRSAEEEPEPWMDVGRHTRPDED